METLNLSDLRKISKKFLKKPEPHGCRLLTEAPNVYPGAADSPQTDRPQAAGPRAAQRRESTGGGVSRQECKHPTNRRQQETLTFL